MTATTDQRTLVLVCEECEEPVTGKHGYVHVSRASIARVQRATDEVRRNQDGRLMSDIPGMLSTDEFRDSITEKFTIGGSASWHTHHFRCCSDSDDYGFSTDKIDTAEKLLAKTADMLSGRNTWLTYTNWGSFLRRVLDTNGWPTS